MFRDCGKYTYQEMSGISIHESFVLLVMGHTGFFVLDYGGGGVFVLSL